MTVQSKPTNEGAPTLADFTSAGLLIPDVRGLDATAVIKELSVVLQRAGHVSDLLQFYQSALNREYLCSTATEPGWAIPHATVKGMDQPRFALGRCGRPVAWTTSGGQQVNLVFLFAVPETDARAYLNLVSGVARLSQEQTLVQQLHRARGGPEMLEVLQQVKVRGPR